MAERAVRVGLALLAAAAVGAVWLAQQPDETAPAAGSRSVLLEGPVTTVVAHPTDSDLLAVKSIAPVTDQVLTCDNYGGFAPMSRADTWIEFEVPKSGTVLVSLSAQTAQAEPDLSEYWGLMVGDEVVASGRIGEGGEPRRMTARFVVADLAPGDQVRVHWAHRSDPGGTANLYVGPGYGPAVFEVWSA